MHHFIEKVWWLQQFDLSDLFSTLLVQEREKQPALHINIEQIQILQFGSLRHCWHTIFPSILLSSVTKIAYHICKYACLPSSSTLIALLNLFLPYFWPCFPPPIGTANNQLLQSRHLGGNITNSFLPNLNKPLTQIFKNARPLSFRQNHPPHNVPLTHCSTCTSLSRQSFMHSPLLLRLSTHWTHSPPVHHGLLSPPSPSVKQLPSR